jgi:hypothetical protein
MTYKTDNCHYAVIFEQCVQTSHEFKSEQIHWFDTSGENIMHNVIILPNLLVFLRFFHERYCIVDDCRVIAWKIKVLACKAVYDGVDLNDSRVNAMLNECSRGGPYPQSSMSS